MRVLLDTCVPYILKTNLQKETFDVVHAKEWLKDPGDEKILEYAHQEKRILVTLDKDFGELAIIKDQPHSGIVRLVDMSIKTQSLMCIFALNHHGDELIKGAVVTIEPGRIRIRPAKNI